MIMEQLAVTVTQLLNALASLPTTPVMLRSCNSVKALAAAAFRLLRLAAVRCGSCHMTVMYVALQAACESTRETLTASQEQMVKFGEQLKSAQVQRWPPKKAGMPLHPGMQCSKHSLT